MKSKIHVNRHNIAWNKTHSDPRPVFTVKDYKQNRKGMVVKIHGPSHMVYRPHHPLSCGAVAWIETEAEVDVL